VILPYVYLLLDTNDTVDDIFSDFYILGFVFLIHPLAFLLTRIISTERKFFRKLLQTNSLSGKHGDTCDSAVMYKNIFQTYLFLYM